MSEQLLPYALTSLQRVKDLLSFTDSNFDALLTREINSVTDFLNKETNRNFLLQKYNSEVHSQRGKSQFIQLRNAPVFYLTDVVQTTAGSNQITLTKASGVAVGMQVVGDGISANTYVTVVNGNIITLNIAALQTNSSADIFVIGIQKLQYRAGTPDNPLWTNFLPTQFEGLEDLKTGTIRVYGFLSTIYNNTIKCSYWAGWLINWSNAGDNLSHTLPADISRTCENIVMRWFKKRQWAGNQSQTLEGSTISYRNALDQQDLDVINHYRRMPVIM